LGFSQHEVVTTERNTRVFLPADRGKAVVHGLLWLAAAFLLGFGTIVIFQSLPFGGSVANRRLVDYAIALAALPLAAAAIATAIAGLRWALLGFWPSPVGVEAAPHGLTLRLGPFGTKSYESAGLDVKYPFELSGDFEDGGFEAFLPEEEQIAKFLPRIIHASGREPLNRIILRYAKGSEAELTAALQPVLHIWRSRDASNHDSPQ
jgi:hypothetical protein